MRKISFLITIGLALFVAWGAIGLSLYVRQTSMVFPMPAERLTPVEAGLEGVRVTHVASADGTPIEVWRAGEGGPLVLLFHGNGEINGWTGARIEMARRLGFSVAAMEYRGYNGNPGTPSEAALAEDADAVLAALRQEGIGPEAVVAWGYSIGSGVAVPLAARQSLRGLVLEAPFLSLAAAAEERFPFLPVRPFLRNPFRSDEAAPRVGAPTLVLAGTRDALVPIAQSEALAALIPGARFLAVAGAGHGDILVHPEASGALGTFLSDVRAGR